MKGKINIKVSNRHISFSLLLERNITIITGDSGTGKTKLVNMVSDYSKQGKTSGVTLSCDKKCIVLESNNWEEILKLTKNSIVFIDESNAFIKTKEFAKNIQNTDNYYVIVTREPLAQLPYSIDAIKCIAKNNKKPKIDKIYDKVSVKNISKFPYDVVLIEDENSGFQLFDFYTKKYNLTCYSANGKSNILNYIKKFKGKKILVVADAAAFGPEIKNIMLYKEKSSQKIDLFLPESFEWLVLKSNVLGVKKKITKILEDPVEYIECKEYFSWERYFTKILTDITKGIKNLEYKKSKLAKGYKTEANAKKIIDAMI